MLQSVRRSSFDPRTVESRLQVLITSWIVLAQSTIDQSVLPCASTATLEFRLQAAKFHNRRWAIPKTIVIISTTNLVVPYLQTVFSTTIYGVGLTDVANSGKLGAENTHHVEGEKWKKLEGPKQVFGVTWHLSAFRKQLVRESSSDQSICPAFWRKFWSCGLTLSNCLQNNLKREWVVWDDLVSERWKVT